MARKVEVEIIGDSRKLERAFQRSSKSAKDFNRDIGRTLRGGIAGSGAFKSLGRSVAFASGAFLGGAGFVSVMKSSVDAASNLSEQMSKTDAVFGDSAKAVQSWSKTSATAMGLAQDQALETAGSFGALLRPLGLTGAEAANQSEKLTQLGADLASFYNTSVTDALDAVRSGLVGESEPLRKYGVLLSEARVTQEALNETGKKNAKQLTQQEKVLARVALIYKDAALAQGDFQKTSGGLANQQRILNAQIRNLEIAIGNNLKPVILDVVRSLNAWLSKSENQKEVTNAVKTAVDLLVGAFKTFKTVLETVNDITGSTKNTLKILFGVLVAFKTARLVATFADIASNVGLIGTRAKGTTGKLVGPGSLRAALVGLTAAAWVITIKFAIEDITDPGSIPRRAKKIWDVLTGPLKNAAGGIPVIGPIVQAAVDANNRLKKSADATKGSLDALSVSVDQVKTKLTGMTTAAIHADAALQRAQKSAFAQSQSLRERGLLGPPGAGAGAGGKGKFKFGGSFLDLLQLRVDQAALTKPLRDDLSAARRLQSYIERLIKRYGHTYKLEQQLLRAKQQVRGILDQQKSLDEDELQKRKDVAERAKEKAKAAREALAAAREAAVALREERQQRFLETGSPFVPSVKKLKDQLARVRKALGSAIDPATRTKLNRIAKILAGAFGAVGKAMREQLKSELDGMRDDVDQGTAHIARVVGVNAGKIAAGLGLTPQQRKALTARLSEIGPHGTVPGRRPVASAAALGGVVITGDVHFHGVQNLRDLEEQVTKRHKGRAHTRRGA